MGDILWGVVIATGWVAIIVLPVLQLKAKRDLESYRARGERTGEW